MFFLSQVYATLAFFPPLMWCLLVNKETLAWLENHMDFCWPLTHAIKLKTKIIQITTICCFHLDYVLIIKLMMLKYAPKKQLCSALGSVNSQMGRYVLMLWCFFAVTKLASALVSMGSLRKCYYQVHWDTSLLHS